MANSASYRCLTLCFVGFLYGLATSAYAGLSAPPKSHVEPIQDGRHMLVFLAPGPEVNDEGKIARLPDGREVNLRKAFPASGYYDISSAALIWTAPWDDKDSWFVSDDGRFLVRVNDFGDGNYRFWQGGDTSWGLKFYDNGREIRSYDVAELLDFPSLMPYTTWDWHHLWFSTADDEPAILDGQFHFSTSTHESYRFDLATGKTVRQFRLWRTLVRVGWAVSAIGLLTVAVLLARWRRRIRIPGPSALERDTENLQNTLLKIRKPYRYSLRSLLVATTIAAVLCLTVPRWPHVVLLTIVVIFAVLFTRSTLGYWGRHAGTLYRSGRRWKVGLRFIATSIIWLSCYILSCAPVTNFLYSHSPDDVRMAVLLTLYRPILWITVAWPDAFAPLKWYFEAWGVN